MNTAKLSAAIHINDLAGDIEMGWIEANTGAVPEQGSTVIAWCCNDGMPCVAFFDLEEGVWYSQTDGVEIPGEHVTHWRYCLAPG